MREELITKTYCPKCGGMMHTYEKKCDYCHSQFKEKDQTCSEEAKQ